MKKLVRSDILGPRRYAEVRDERRRAIIERKKLRRVHVGPQVTMVFENRDTMASQIEEMCRAEGLEDDAKIEEELAVYNQVLPDDGQLAATLFVEVVTEAAIARTLERLVGLQDHVWLVVGGGRVRATFDPDQFKNDKLAAVQYLKFPLGPDEQAALRAPGTAVAVAIDHPNYRHTASLDEPMRAELARDLD
ncbi:MAG TPA: DUF3501 family protein [Polyangia bacterium]|nr:DUF3501 family protein [Polyangia bacterium]